MAGSVIWFVGLGCVDENRPKDNRTSQCPCLIVAQHTGLSVLHFCTKYGVLNQSVIFNLYSLKKVDFVSQQELAVQLQVQHCMHVRRKGKRQQIVQFQKKSFRNVTPSRLRPVAPRSVRSAAMQVSDGTHDVAHTGSKIGMGSVKRLGRGRSLQHASRQVVSR